MDENYTNCHRAFLQACARHSLLSIKQSLDVLASVQKNHGDAEPAPNEAALRTIVDEINAKLTECEIEQQLKFVHFEWDDISGEFLVFCNTFASVGPSPVYNEAECLYMKSLLGKIIMSDTHSVSVMAAVHVCLSSSQSQSTTKKVSKQRAEELVDEWAAAGYLITVGDSITLGPRGIAEYRDTFRTKFGDYMHSCRLCNEIALQPHLCPNDNCYTALDKRCFKSYVLKQKKCPDCKLAWTNDENEAD